MGSANLRSSNSNASYLKVKSRKGGALFEKVTATQGKCAGDESWVKTADGSTELTSLELAQHPSEMGDR